MPDGMVMTADKLCVGVITGAHGIRGNVRVKSFTADPAQLAAYGVLTDERGKATYRMTVTGQAKGQLIAKIEGIADRDAAEALKGTDLYIDRAMLPEAEDGEFYHADLLGLEVQLADGKVHGTVKAVHDFGSGDLLEITLTSGKTEMLPFTSEVVPTVDLADGRIVVELPDEVIVPPEGSDEREEGER